MRFAEFRYIYVNPSILKSKIILTNTGDCYTQNQFPFERILVTSSNLELSNFVESILFTFTPHKQNGLKNTLVTSLFGSENRHFSYGQPPREMDGDLVRLIFNPQIVIFSGKIHWVVQNRE